MSTEPELATTTAAVAEVPAAPQPASTLFVGVTGSVDAEQLRTLATAILAGGTPGSAQLTLAYPGADSNRIAMEDGCELLSYPLPTAEGSNSPWAHTAAAQTALLGLAAQEEAQTVVLIHSDLGALEPEALMQLAGPVLARAADLVMASYALGPFDSLLNSSILAPLNRALYGKHVRFPLAPDFALSARMAARLRMRANSGATTPVVLWPATVAAGIDAAVFEVQLSLHHPAPSGDVELSTVIGQLVGSIFSEMETHAPLWQRVRAGQPPVPRPSPAAPAATHAAAQAIDTAPMIKSFLLGSRSLQDVWGMVLPPVTLLDLRRVTLLPPEKFRLPDELWVRIIYDFALGYRLRTINRSHLLGALTPLYLGWVASFVHEATTDPAFDAAARAERLARAFEDGKPYLVRRWRWPDRFNP